MSPVSSFYGTLSESSGLRVRGSGGLRRSGLRPSYRPSRSVVEGSSEDPGSIRQSNKDFRKKKNGSTYI